MMKRFIEGVQLYDVEKHEDGTALLFANSIGVITVIKLTHKEIEVLKKALNE